MATAPEMREGGGLRGRICGSTACSRAGGRSLRSPGRGRSRSLARPSRSNRSRQQNSVARLQPPSPHAPATDAPSAHRRSARARARMTAATRLSYLPRRGRLIAGR